MTEPRSAPTAPSRAISVLAIVFGVLAVIASLGAGLLVLLGTSFFAVSTRSAGDAHDVMGSGCALAVPLTIAFMLGVAAIVSGARKSTKRPSLALVFAAIALALVPATFVVPWVLLATAPREQIGGANAIQYLNPSEIGRDCHAGQRPNGDCTVGYLCMGGELANPATAAFTCQIACGAPDYCPYRTSCGPRGVCVFDVPR